MQRLWLIAYDIADDRRRARVDRRLLAVGERVQWSAFESFLHPDEQRTLARDLSELIDPLADTVIFYPLCLWCQERVDITGKGRHATDPAAIIV